MRWPTRSSLRKPTAAEAAGDKAKAKANYEKLIALAGSGDARPELAAAKAFVAKN